MTSLVPLTQVAISTALESLEGWEVVQDKLTKTFVFTEFREAISFMLRVAFIAEAQNHHPEWSNIYNKVVISLTTHDASNKITQKDIAFAQAVEAFSWV